MPLLKEFMFGVGSSVSRWLLCINFVFKHWTWKWFSEPTCNVILQGDISALNYFVKQSLRSATPNQTQDRQLIRDEVVDRLAKITTERNKTQSSDEVEQMLLALVAISGNYKIRYNVCTSYVVILYLVRLYVGSTVSLGPESNAQWVLPVNCFRNTFNSIGGVHFMRFKLVAFIDFECNGSGI